MTVGDPPSKAGRRKLVVVSWLFGLALIAVVVLVSTHLTEERDFARLLERVRPRWLLVAALLQVGTYWVEAQIWWVALDRSGARRRLRTLVGLAFSKLFVDQTLPSGGLSGSLLVVRGLERRGVSRATSLAAVLLDLRAYYLAYLTAVAGALALLSTHQRLPRLIVIPSALFIVGVAAGSLLLAYWTRRGRLPAVRLAFVKPVFAALLDAEPTVMRDGRLLAACWLLELVIFALDALTLGVALHAVGAPAHPGPVFASFMLASLARTMGLVPGGLGTFEAVSVATLGATGVPVAAALAATLLFRGFSFWLPLVPGLFLTRHESERAQAAP